MKKLLTVALLAAALTGIAAPAQAAYYKVTVCDVETAKNKTATEQGEYVFTGNQLPDGDYVGNCQGYGIVLRPGNRYGQKR